MPSFSGDSSLSYEVMVVADPRMWGLLLLGLLVGVIPPLAAAALVRYLSQSRDNGHQGASPRAQAAPAEGVDSDRLEGGQAPGLERRRR